MTAKLTATAADVGALVRMFLNVISSRYSDKRDAARYNHAPVRLGRRSLVGWTIDTRSEIIG
jgi:hypothetical protein